MPSKKRASRKAGPSRKITKRASKVAGSRRTPRPTSEPDRDPQARVVELALAAFAHEVRTPLTGILAVSTLLETSDLGERERGWVETIQASAEHLAALTTLVVDAARSGGYGLVVNQTTFDLRALAQGVADSLAGRAMAKGLRSAAAIDPALPALAVGDSVRLRAALENLIDNAVKFTDSGRVGFEVSVLPAPKRSKTIVIAFSVADSGVGLTAADIKKLFKPFTQTNIDVARRFGGAGLGLWSVRQLARAMGGDVTARPQADGGTVFTLTAALRRADDNDVAQAALPDAGSPVALRALKVLSVEDNPFGRVVLNAILQELGHHAEFIGRGEDAAERLAQGGYDVVLMDMVLPGIDGVESIRRIRTSGAATAKIAIIGISGRDSDESAARAAGANAFLLKPVSPRALAAALASAVAG